MSFLLSTWHLAEKEAKVDTKWHLNSPLFNNYSLLSGRIPLSFLAWSTKGVHTLADVFNDSGFRDFNDLKVTYSLPGTSLFLYFQSSMKAYVCHGAPHSTPLLCTPFCLTRVRRGVWSLDFTHTSRMLLTSLFPLYTCGLRNWSIISAMTLKTQIINRSTLIISTGPTS